jgi:enamine deaminase RidA (YjgF/YER057c/UK114 family)
MDVRRISSGSPFEEIAGYSRAVVVERDDCAEVFVSGCTGFDYASMTISDDVVAQARQCFVNITAALAAAGGLLCHVVRVRYYLPDAAHWERVAPVFGEALYESRPAATCLICGLVDPAMKIEIEVDARIPR